MNTRIQLFLDYKKISHAEFANSIGVQRSNITHVIQGRNKPGFQFLTNMLNAFPEINARWLLTGKGEMLEEGFEPNIEPNLFSALEFNISDEIKDEAEILNSEKEEKIPEAMPFPSKDENEKVHEKKIQLIVIFNTDNSFTHYKPS